MGEPDNDDLREILEDSNPNSAGEDQLAGGMGVSSERVDPDGADAGIEGTGTHGNAVGRTNGTTDTSSIDDSSRIDDASTPG